ncbi:MAG: hypothetical protein D6732_04975 [Methanobacteriota archaeon]|nr:MAG: hypothetical protein D6732_04975 [Euryarchaeota archaeon]
MKVHVPSRAKEAMRLIEDAGFTAFIVGGTVRDLLLAELYNFELNLKDFDIDIATNARPDEIKKIFKGYKQFYAGIRHGTVGVYFKGVKIDITTFRVEGSYSDGRRPDNVEFVSDLKADLARRDFTINAMAADSDGNVHDPFNGLEDLKNKTIRAVGVPQERFEEDSLRIIRAIRFASKLNFEIENQTLNAIKHSASLLKKHNVSLERIYVELKKTFEARPSIGIKYLNQTGLSDVLFPESSDWCKSLEKKYHSILNMLDIETTFALIYLRGLFNHLKIDENFSEKNIDKISKFFLKRYPGMGKWQCLRIAVKLILLDGAFHLSDQQTSNGEIRRWIFKPAYYFSMRQKNFALPLLEETKKTLSLMGELDNSSYTQLQAELEKFKQGYMILPKPLNGDDLKKIGLKGRVIKETLRITSMLDFISLGNFDSAKFMEELSNSSTKRLSTFRHFICQSNPTYSPDEDFSILEWLKTESRIRMELGSTLTLIIENEEAKRMNFANMLKKSLLSRNEGGIKLFLETNFF